MHYAKYGKVAVGSILLHSDRGIDSKDTHSHSNDCIDSTRTHLNYDLKDRHGQTAYAYYKQRIDEINNETKERTGKSIRKDAITLCSWVITVPKKLPEECHKDFFRACYRWFLKRYGEKNIVTSAVHYDETTPHMHLQFTPIIQEDGFRRLCAKDIETKITLQKVHQELQSYLRKYSPFLNNVELLNGATADGNKSIEQLKKISKQQEQIEKNKKIIADQNIKIEKKKLN